jgi:hypothetical protein
VFHAKMNAEYCRQGRKDKDEHGVEVVSEVGQLSADAHHEESHSDGHTQYRYHADGHAPYRCQ